MMQSLGRAMWWIRDGRNPVLPPLEDSEVECACCMNPFVLPWGETYRLYYAGGDADGHKRICMAEAPVDDLGAWRRHGVVLDLGEPGAFDAHWTVLPHVVRVGDRWHLYYTGNRGSGEGLSSFPGIGLAVSDDAIHFERHGSEPVLAVTGRPGDPDRYGIAGGSVIEVALADGSTEWRFYYTACPSLGDDVFRNQQKICCFATSGDGVCWEKRGPVRFRDAERDYVNVAAAGPVAWQEDDGTFRMVYSAIGTRWGYYSICYAESEDGLVWRSGERYGDDLTLGPRGQGWERQMVEYPSVVREGSSLRLFYCGNGYGSTGIGTAVSAPLRAHGVRGASTVRVTAHEPGLEWSYRMPEGIGSDEGMFKSHAAPIVDWHGPTEDGLIWHEWQTNDEHSEQMRADELLRSLGLVVAEGLHYRTIIRHVAYGLEIVFTATNTSDAPFHNVTAFPCLGHPSAAFRDDGMERTFIRTGAGWAALRDTDRGGGDPVRTHYHVSGMQPKRFFGEPFWGEASATVADHGMILRVSEDGRWTIGTNWERVAEIFHNEDAHHCIHSVPSLGDIAPGDTATVKGRIVFVEGGVEAAAELLAFPAGA